MNINHPETYTRMLCSLKKSTTVTRIMIPPRMLGIVNDSSITPASQGNEDHRRQFKNYDRQCTFELINN